MLRQGIAEEPWSSHKADWSCLHRDILVYIFSKLNQVDRFVIAAAMCRSWREAVSDPSLSCTLDMAKCREQAFDRFFERSYVSKRVQLELAFIRGINLGLHNLTKLVFDPPFHVSDRHLMYAAPRCPNLQELVLPYLDNTTDEGITFVFRHWTRVKSLFLAYEHFSPSVNVISIAGRNCPELNTLKICATFFHLEVATEIVTHMPGLKRLSMYCTSLVMPDSVGFLLSSLPDLEEFCLAMGRINYTRCRDDGCACLAIILEDRAIREKTLRIRSCHICCIQDDDRCIAMTMGAPPLNIPPP